jgi:hypothetical protein
MEKRGWRERIAGKVRRARATSSNRTTPLDRPSSLPPHGDNKTTGEPQWSNTSVIDSVAELDTFVTPADAPALPRQGTIGQFELVQMNELDGDAKRTLDRYTGALRNLKDELNRAHGGGKLFQIPELENIPNDLEPSQLREAINRVFESSAASARNPSKWAKCKRVVEAVYTALSPFLKNVLLIMTEPQAVCCNLVPLTG